MKGVLKMSNKIPRKFNCIIGEILINTNMDKKNDILNIRKNDNGGYTALNTRTNKQAYCFGDMLRNTDLFKLIKIEY
jgi:hypothetical protein